MFTGNNLTFIVRRKDLSDCSRKAGSIQQLDLLMSSNADSLSEGAESPINQSVSNAASELSSDVLCVLVVGAGVDGLAAAVALSQLCEVHVYEQSESATTASCETAVPLTEELQSWCKVHGVDLVSHFSC
jgi:hypothetical protein